MVSIVGRRPALALPMLVAAWRFRARDWYRRPPFLPMPAGEYIAWRLHTAYGDDERMPEPAEIERYLAWTSRMRGRMR